MQKKNTFCAPKTHTWSKGRNIVIWSMSGGRRCSREGRSTKACAMCIASTQAKEVHVSVHRNWKEDGEDAEYGDMIRPSQKKALL